MKAGMYHSNSDVRVEQLPTPELGAKDILVEVMACGICGSDLMEWYRMKRAPLVLGHELTGRIVQTGRDVTRWQVGDRVFVTHHVPCDRCRYCRGGHHTACEAFHSENNFEYGGFAELLRVSGRSVETGTLGLPDDLSYEAGTFIEPLGTVIRGARAMGLRPDDRIAVIGSGLAGILFVKLARSMGVAQIAACDVSDYRMEMATRAGAHFTVSATGDVRAQIEQHTDGELADKVVVCAGAVQAAESALRCVDRGGTVLFFAVPRPGETIAVDFNPYWRNDIRLITSYGAAPRDNAQALDMLAAGHIDVSDMITHRFPLDDIGEAFRTAARSTGTLKVIVEPNPRR